MTADSDAYPPLDDATSWVTESAVMWKAVEWLHSQLIIISAMHVPGYVKGTASVKCRECHNEFPCESTNIASNAFMGARDLLGNRLGD